MKATHCILSFALCSLPVITITAQLLPKNPTASQLAGYYVKEQQNWQVKQLPAGSVTYKFTASNSANRLYTFNLNKQQPVVTSVPKPASHSLQPVNKFISAPYLQVYIRQEQERFIKWQKQSWWKDPAQAPGAELLKSFLKK